MGKTNEFVDDMVEAMRSRGILSICYVGETETLRCSRDDVPLWKFKGIRDGKRFVAHSCPKCRRVSLWSRDVPEPAEYFELPGRVFRDL